ncbi:Phosphoglycerate mutase [Balamuthia mandrillaris]
MPPTTTTAINCTNNNTTTAKATPPARKSSHNQPRKEPSTATCLANGNGCSNKPPKEVKLVAGQKGKLLKGKLFYKPVKSDATEKEFYTELINNEFAALKPYVLPFHGVEKLTVFTNGSGDVVRVRNGEEIMMGAAAPQSKKEQTEVSEEREYLVFENIFHSYEKPALIDIKVGLPSKQLKKELRLSNGDSQHKEHQEAEPLPRESAANLLRCFIHGVECDKLVFRNHVNEYQGKLMPLEHFDRTLRLFLSKMGPQPELITKLHSLIGVLQEFKSGERFASTSLLLTFDQAEGRPPMPKLYLIDFERLLTAEEQTPDEDVIRALRQVLLTMRTEWGEKVPTVYLVRHGERYDYTDVNWAPKATHPHDSHLSEAGTSQAYDLVDRLCIANPHLIVSSPFQRAVLFAEPLARRLRRKIAIEPGICEFLCKKTRKRVPNFISEEVSVSPWVDTEYEPFWPTLELEAWEDVFMRTKRTLEHLLQLCEGKGDLVIVSHRSTLQTIVAALLQSNTRSPVDFDTKLEYGAMATLYKDLDGEWLVHSFNELRYLRYKIKSPSSNPWRHIEGYYEDLDWSCYKSTSQMAQTPHHKENNKEEEDEETKEVTANGEMNGHHHS